MEERKKRLNILLSTLQEYMEYDYGQPEEIARKQLIRQKTLSKIDEIRTRISKATWSYQLRSCEKSITDLKVYAYVFVKTGGSEKRFQMPVCL